MAFFILLWPVSFINHNGNLLPAGQPVLLADNRSYRYGDGLFETMRIHKGKIFLANYHFERLFNSFQVLLFDIPQDFTAEKFTKEVIELCKMNNCIDSARVRISFSRGNGSLAERDLPIEYLIECDPLESFSNNLNEKGLTIDIYPDARKTCDVFANLKSSNCLCYVMANEYARRNGLDDSLVLNTNGHIADSTIANIFIVKGTKILTPSLNQGCVAGVMRRYVLEKVKGLGWRVEEGVCTISDLETADEVFLTNVVRGVRWVGRFRDKTNNSLIVKEIFNKLII